MTAAAVRTPSQRGAANRNRGIQAERDLSRWLRGHGWPHAERAVRTGFRTLDRDSTDPGDLTGTPGIVWSVKDCATERTDAWMDELDDMDACPVDLRLLVVKRRGHADPGRWWCWMWQGQYLDLYRQWLDRNGGPSTYYDPLPSWQPDGTDYPLRMELGHVVPLLRAVGYGDAT